MGSVIWDTLEIATRAPSGQLGAWKPNASGRLIMAVWTTEISRRDALFGRGFVTTRRASQGSRDELRRISWRRRRPATPSSLGRQPCRGFPRSTRPGSSSLDRRTCVPLSQGIRSSLRVSVSEAARTSRRTGKSVRNSSVASATAVFAATTETQIATGDFVDPNGGKLTCSQWCEQRWPTKAASLRASTRARDEGN